MSQPNTFEQSENNLWPKQDFTQSNFADDERRAKTWKEKISKHVDNPYKIAEETGPWPDFTHTNILKDQNYKFNEDKLIDELKEYIDGTYESHYSKNQFQSTEFIVDCGHGDGFCIGNIIKYAQRYGKKNGKSRKDLLKIMHYAIIALSILDDEDKRNENM